MYANFLLRMTKTSTFQKIGNFKKSVTLAIPEFKQSSVVCFQLVCPIYKSRLQEFIFSDKNADFSLIDGPLKTTQIIYLTRVSRILGFLLINLKIGFWIIREYSLLRSIIGSFKIKPSCQASEIEKLNYFEISISRKNHDSSLLRLFKCWFSFKFRSFEYYGTVVNRVLPWSKNL